MINSIIQLCEATILLFIPLVTLTIFNKVLTGGKKDVRSKDSTQV